MWNRYASSIRNVGDCAEKWITHTEVVFGLFWSFLSIYFLKENPEKTLHLLHTFRMDRLTEARALSAKCLCLLSALAWNSKNIISYRGRMGTKTRPTCSVQKKRTRFWKTAAFEKPPRGQIQAFKKNPRRSGKCQVFEWLFLVQVICQMNRPIFLQTWTMWSQCGLS